MNGNHSIINRSDTAQRADKLLAESLPRFSRAALAKLFDKNLVLSANGKPLKAGDKIQPALTFDADISPLQQEQQVEELPILYEDDDVLVINKPSGIISHSRGRYWYEPSVASFVRSKVASELSDERAGIVHRLDRATSGVMICAKHEKALKYLQKQFSNRTVTKQYIAVCSGVFKEMKAKIDVPIARNPHKPTTFMAHKDGKPAVTVYEVLRQGPQAALVSLQPQTGRTHQLRIHMAYIGHPILGDAYYGEASSASRLLLHAHSLTITLPNGKMRTFEAALPHEFEVLA